MRSLPRRATTRLDIGGASIGGESPLSTWLIPGYEHGMGGGHDVRELSLALAAGNAGAAGICLDLAGTDEELSVLREAEAPDRGFAGHVPTLVACDGLSIGPEFLDGQICDLADLLLYEPLLAFSEERGGWAHDVAERARQAAGADIAPGLRIGPGSLDPASRGSLEERIAASVVAGTRLVLEATGKIALWTVSLPHGTSPRRSLRLACGALFAAGIPAPLLLPDETSWWMLAEEGVGEARLVRRPEIIWID